MSDWDDSWYDDDEFPPMRSKRGRGGIVAVAVVTFIMCAFNALCSSCLFFCGFIFAAIENGNGNFLPGDLMKHRAIILLVTGLTSGIAFVLQIVAGIGLVNGRRWSRTLSFYLASYSVLMAGFLIYLLAVTLTSNGLNADDAVGQAILYFIGIAFHGGYAATAFLVLLNRQACASLR